MPFWESSAFWGIAGIVAGAIITTFFFLIGQNRKILEYRVTSTNLITKEMTNIPGICITLDENPLADLTSTIIQFINSGNQTIDTDDFATLEPLSVTVTGQFLNNQHGYQVSCDNPNSCPYIKIVNNNTANIEFDFLKPGQSFTVTLWHSGSLFVLGELKTGTKKEYREIDTLRKPLYFSFALLSLINMYMVYKFICGYVYNNSTFFALIISLAFEMVFWMIPILISNFKQKDM